MAAAFLVSAVGSAFFDHDCGILEESQNRCIGNTTKGIKRTELAMWFKSDLKFDGCPFKYLRFASAQGQNFVRNPKCMTKQSPLRIWGFIYSQLRTSVAIDTTSNCRPLRKTIILSRYVIISYFP